MEDINTVTTTEETPQKKPFILQKPIIIACCVFLSALLAFGIFKAVKNIFTPGIEGTWLLYENSGEKSDSNEYYSFEKDSVLRVKTGTITALYSWSYADADGSITDSQTGKVIIYSEGLENQGRVLDYSVDGTAFSKNELTLEDGETFILKLKNVSKEEMSSFKMDVPKDNKVDEKLCGKWYNEEANASISFDKDGRFTFTTKMNVVDGVYSSDKKKSQLSLSIFQSEEMDMGSYKYTVKDGNLTVSGLQYVFGVEEFKKK